MLFMSQEFGCKSGKCTPVNWPSFDISCHLSLTPCQLVQIANSCNWWTFRSRCDVYTGHQARRSTQVQLKLTHISFAIVNSYVTGTYLRFIKNTFLGGKTEKIEIAIFPIIYKMWLFSSKKNKLLVKQNDICQKILHFKIY